MFESIPNLITPIMLAFAPPADLPPKLTYDWTNQKAVIGEAGDSEAIRNLSKTLYGTKCNIGVNISIDDWFQD